jgi:DNA-binding IclR family transcriptional regulator
MTKAAQIIALLRHHPDGLSTKTVAEKIGAHPFSTANLLGKLNRRDKIIRTYSDGRSRRNRPTWKPKQQQEAATR